MRLAIMQPYVFPYLGYFQLVHAVDRFIFYDDVNFIKRGWIHRNNVLINEAGHRFSIPLNKASQHAMINEVTLHPTEYPAWRDKFLKTLQQHYRKAPNLEPVYHLVRDVLHQATNSIATLAINSVTSVCNYLSLAGDFAIASHLAYDRSLRGTERIMALCEQQGATDYINPAGGRALYESEAFDQRGLTLHFIDPKPINYEQFSSPFVPHLSVIDVLMFNPRERVQAMLTQYQLTRK